MSIYMKLAKIRVALQDAGLSKTGENKYAGYKYFELGDFLPTVNKLMLEHKVCSVMSFGDIAVLELIDAENPSDKLAFTSPIAEAKLKGCHDIQNLGAVQTYLRRYLWINALEISESDPLDAVTGKAQTKKEDKTNYRQEIGKMLMEMANNDKNRAMDLLEQYTAFEGKNGTVAGKRDLSKLSEKALQPTYGKIKKDYNGGT